MVMPPWIRTVASGASISVVSKASGFLTSAPTGVSTSSTLSIAAGDTLIVSCGAFNLSGTLSVSDTGSANTFVASPLGVVSNGGSNTFLQQFYVLQTTAVASDTISCIASGSSSFATIDVIQARGFSGTSAIDQTFSGTVTTSSPITSGAFTTTAANELIVAAVTDGSGTTYTAGSGYTLQNTDSNNQSADETKIVSSIQTAVTASMTFSPTGNPVVMAGITIKQ